MQDPTCPRPTPGTARRRVLMLAVALLAVLIVTILWSANRSRRAEVNRLVELLSLREGMTVGEIGLEAAGSPSRSHNASARLDASIRRS